MPRLAPFFGHGWPALGHGCPALAPCCAYTHCTVNFACSHGKRPRLCTRQTVPRLPSTPRQLCRGVPRPKRAMRFTEEKEVPPAKGTPPGGGKAGPTRASWPCGRCADSGCASGRSTVRAETYLSWLVYHTLPTRALSTGFLLDLRALREARSSLSASGTHI